METNMSACGVVAAREARGAEASASEGVLVLRYWGVGRYEHDCVMPNKQL